MDTTTTRLVAATSDKFLQRNWGEVRALTMFDAKIGQKIPDERQFLNESILAGCFLYPPFMVGGTQYTRQTKYREYLQHKFENNEHFMQFLAHLYARTMAKTGIRFIFTSKPAKDTYGEVLITFLMDNTGAINTIYEYLYPDEKRTYDLPEGE